MRRFLLFIALAAAAHAQDYRFGVQTHYAQGSVYTYWTLANPPNLIGQTAGAGMLTGRDECFWNNVETSLGVYSFTLFDPYMEALKTAGIQPLMTLDFANPLYDGGDTPYDSSGITGFTNYATAVVNHYNGSGSLPLLNYVELWDEYNGQFCTGTALTNRPYYYELLLQSVYPAVHAANSGITLIACATSGTDLVFDEGVFNYGGLPYMDGISFHPYEYTNPPEGEEQNVAQVQTLLNCWSAGSKPIWVTEIGWDSNSNWTNTIQAEYVTRAYALFLQGGSARTYWYELIDDPSNNSGLDLGLLTNAGATKPAITAMTTLTTQLSGYTFAKREGKNWPSPFYDELFEDGSAQLRIIWSTTSMIITPSGATSCVDYLGNTVSVSGPITLAAGLPIFLKGPVTGLPGQGRSVLADTLRGFASTQNTNGWQQGYYTGGSGFVQCPTFQLPATSIPQWVNGDFFFYITENDQLPSSNGGAQVAAVRRWTASTTDEVEINTLFTVEQSGGAGVGVGVAVNGTNIFRHVLAGTAGVTDSSTYVVSVVPGTTIDFFVDTGTTTSNTDDATGLYATITSSGSSGSVCLN